MIKTCERENCDIKFYVNDRNKYKSMKRFCSRQCWLKTFNKPGAAHSLNGAARGSQTMIKKLRGTGTKTYVKENNRHQHRVVAERLIGRKLQLGEVVHHEDHNKKNNHPDNLLIFPTQGEHAKHHKLGHTEGRNLPCDCSTISKLT